MRVAVVMMALAAAAAAAAATITSTAPGELESWQHPPAGAFVDPDAPWQLFSVNGSSGVLASVHAASKEHTTYLLALRMSFGGGGGGATSSPGAAVQRVDNVTLDWAFSVEGAGEIAGVVLVYGGTRRVLLRKSALTTPHATVDVGPHNLRADWWEQWRTHLESGAEFGIGVRLHNQHSSQSASYHLNEVRLHAHVSETEAEATATTAAPDINGGGGDDDETTTSSDDDDDSGGGSTATQEGPAPPTGQGRDAEGASTSSLDRLVLAIALGGLACLCVIALVAVLAAEKWRRDRRTWGGGAAAARMEIRRADDDGGGARNDAVLVMGAGAATSPPLALLWCDGRLQTCGDAATRFCRGDRGLTHDRDVGVSAALAQLAQTTIAQQKQGAEPGARLPGADRTYYYGRMRSAVAVRCEHRADAPSLDEVEHLQRLRACLRDSDLIVRFFGVHYHLGLPYHYLVYELAECGSLREYACARVAGERHAELDTVLPRWLADLCAIGMQLGSALMALHRLNYLAGEFTWQTVLLSRYGARLQCRLGGVAAHARLAQTRVSEEPQRRCVHERVLVTHQAPEVCTDGRFSARSDAYLLGMTLLESFLGGAHRVPHYAAIGSEHVPAEQAAAAVLAAKRSAYDVGNLLAAAIGPDVDVCDDARHLLTPLLDPDASERTPVLVWLKHAFVAMRDLYGLGDGASGNDLVAAYEGVFFLPRETVHEAYSAAGSPLSRLTGTPPVRAAAAAAALADDDYDDEAGASANGSSSDAPESSLPDDDDDEGAQRVIYMNSSDVVAAAAAAARQQQQHGDSVVYMNLAEF